MRSPLRKFPNVDNDELDRFFFLIISNIVAHYFTFGSLFVYLIRQFRCIFYLYRVILIIYTQNVVYHTNCILCLGYLHLNPNVSCTRNRARVILCGRTCLSLPRRSRQRSAARAGSASLTGTIALEIRYIIRT